VMEDAKSRFRAARDHGSPQSRKAGEAAPGAVGEVAKERTVKITLELPASVHRKLRQRVLDEGTDASKYLRRLLEQDL
jgi:hypothetical protein